MEAFFEFEKPIVALEKRLQELRELAKAAKTNKAEQNDQNTHEPPARDSSDQGSTQERAARDFIDFSPEIQALEAKVNSLIDEVYGGLSSWQRVQLSRHPARPYAMDYLPLIFDDFFELHGDRAFGDDPAMLAGLTSIDGRSVAVCAIQKGRNTKQKIERNFGMAKPEGYRKALRIMKLAAQFNIPIVTFIDTPGAYPGLEAEERGQSEAIARSIMEMFALETPIVACVIGEGGSGGALAVAVADRVLMQEFSTYSVISPESCASILWSDSSMNENAAKIMKMTPEEIKPLEVIDEIVDEPKGGAHRDPARAAALLKKALIKNLDELFALTPKQLLAQRHKKFRYMGETAFSKPSREKEDS